jgi:hypothetical protein
MSRLSRRSVLRGSVGLAAAGSLASPFIANAAAKTATVWWTQGFVPEEDAAFKTIVAAYEKASGNTIEASITPFAPPALAAVGTFALLLAWNEYLLLSSGRNMTVAVAIAQFFDADEAPWNYMMAAAIVYAMPPVAIFFALRRYILAGLTMGSVKG